MIQNATRRLQNAFRRGVERFRASRQRAGRGGAGGSGG